MTKKNNMGEAVAAFQQNSRDINRAVKSMHAYSDMGEGLSNLNTMRGGVKGFKGFVMEELEAGHSSAIGRYTEVINNNGLADLRHIKADGTEVLKQMKSGYKPGQVDFAKYEGQIVTMDKGNPYLRIFQEEGKKTGVKVVEGHVTDAEAKALAKTMQLESKITGSKNATVTSQVYSGAKQVSAAHNVGLKAAKSGAIAGAGFSLGCNIVEVARGRKNISEAAGDVVFDTTKAGAIGYGAGAVGSMAASTTVGSAAIGLASSAATAVTSAPVVGTAVTASASALATASAAISAGTSAALSTVGLTAIAPVAAAAAPFVVGGIILGGIGSLIFED